MAKKQTTLQMTNQSLQDNAADYNPDVSQQQLQYAALRAMELGAGAGGNVKTSGANTKAQPAASVRNVAGAKAGRKGK